MATKSTPNLRIAVDIGGTFTDMAAFDEATGKLLFGKALSTHGEPTSMCKTASCSFTAPPSRSTRCWSATAPTRRC
jgi:hypothetical protein